MSRSFVRMATVVAGLSLVLSCGSAPPAPPPAPPLAMSDVSVLFPLPRDGAAPGYLAPTDQGARGELLPKAVYDLIPGFPVVPAQGLIYDRMRVVGVRFDACGGVPSICHKEVRLVLQPINADGGSRDSALHLFYRVDDVEMRQIVDGLRALRSLEPEVALDGALDVHPALVAQGVEGPYGAALRALLLAHLGADNLERMTFFLRAPPVADVWFFGGFERVAGDETFYQMDIVGVGQREQRVILQGTDADYDYSFTPAAATPEDGTALLTAAKSSVATPEERQAAMASFLRVENPRKYVPDQLPCAGCHVATFVTAETARVHGLAATSFPDDAFAAPTRNLLVRGGAEFNARSLRAFGWFGTEAMIARRTVHETAAVLDDLAARYP